MHPFILPLPNNATVAGIHSIPPPSIPLQTRPLIVALHGGTYNCHYFDATPTYTAATTSHALNIPFIAIDRPCYGGTTSFLPLDPGSPFNEEIARHLHQSILPALWTEFGLPNNCNSLVLLCHSFGSMSGIITAALHAQDRNPAYPLAGLILSGMGDKQTVGIENAPPMQPNAGPEHVLFQLPGKDSLMFRPGTVDASVLEQSERLNAASPVVEFHQVKAWLRDWKGWAGKVAVPVMFALVENDVFCEASEAEVRLCVEAFGRSERVDGSFVRGPPHCMELSYWAGGWYARCFGFAMECAVGVWARSAGEVSE
ncbi:hypothetical protein BJY04DRAFT_217380 [Aspergillus karnatakaensis]|uniref:uncharacterized protein n=1 Tax=Aspergillus karnatakaensis TaxID=1810916 RepID=UPI003CCE435A